MPLKLHATAIKDFHQYRCERQVRYLMMDGKQLKEMLQLAQPDHENAWAREGVKFEKRVIDQIAAGQAVLQPPPGVKYLEQGESVAFLNRQLKPRMAHQLCLRPTPGDHFYQELSVPGDVIISTAYLDLVKIIEEADKPPVIRICDVKFTQIATPFHKIQVAYYSLLVESALKDLGSTITVDPIGEILHAAPPETGELFVTDAFPLRGYRAQVVDFFKREVPRLAKLRVDEQVDETFFHLYFKCEQCDFLAHCEKTIAMDKPHAQWDVSAVHGLSQQSKRTLVSMNIKTVADLAAANDLPATPDLNWSLNANARLLVSRAAAIASGKVARFPDRHTYRMPPRIDVAIYLLADHDPVEGRLATIGCLVDRLHAGERAFTLHPIAERGGPGEHAALVSVMQAVATELADVDSHNQLCEQNGDHSNARFAHIFLYEPSEAADLQRAMGRHLASADVRQGLLRMVQMFPPEDFPPEPEYKGVQHVPATALRSVIEDLYAIPARVSYDLAAVTQALAKSDPPLLEPYLPTKPFGAIFSSRLNIDCCRDLKDGKLPPAAVADDMRARLSAMASLTAWVLRDNADSREKFLRLSKAPFRFQQTFDPLAAAELDILRAHEILQSRAAELQRLVELAQPFTARRARFDCLAELKLIDDPELRKRRMLRFHVPPLSRDAELDSGTMGVILTNNDPDVLLDPRLWGEFEVRIRDDGQSDPSIVTVQVSQRVWQGARFAKLLKQNATGDWFLDRRHVDFNSPRTEKFLVYLGGGGS
jgi:hypothetical protein